MKSKTSKNSRQCATCQYFTGCSTSVCGATIVEFDPKERAKCNLTGFEKAAWQSCNKHEKRHNL